MIEDAKSKGANAILGFRFQTSTVAQGQILLMELL